MISVIEQDIEKRLSELKQKSDFAKIAQLISYAFETNYTLSNRRIFGYIPGLFREIVIDKEPNNINAQDIAIGEPVIYKIYFPAEKTIAQIPYFYLFCYLKGSSHQLDVYFQSANRHSEILSQQDYTLAQKKITFQGMISAFENNRSTICISDPGHFVPGLHSSYFVGSADLNFAEFISKIIEKICNLAHISLQDTLLFGPSAGGVGALLSSTYFSDKVHVMSANSQIDVYRLLPTMRAFLGTDDTHILLSKFGDQVSCTHRFQQDISSVPNIYLLANINDNIYAKNCELYQIYQQRFVSKGKNNQSIFDSYYGFEGHVQPDKAALKRKMDFARANLTLQLNPSEKLKNQQIAAERAEIEFVKASNFKEQGHLDQAIPCYQKAIALQPEYKAVTELINLYQLQGNHDEAIKYCRDFIEFKPKHAYIYVRLARILKSQGQVHDAIFAYQKAIKLKPELTGNVYQELGNLLLQEKNDDLGAIAVYQQGLKNNPDWQPCLEYYLNLAQALAKQKQFDGAIEWYQKVLQLNPDKTDIYSLLGDIYAQQGEKDQAEAYYQKFTQAAISSEEKIEHK